MKNLNKVATVAGVGFGLGEALCQRLIKEGYRVAGLSRSTKVGNELVTALVKRPFCHYSVILLTHIQLISPLVLLKNNLAQRRFIFIMQLTYIWASFWKPQQKILKTYGR